jgi:hypothetical protein
MLPVSMRTNPTISFNEPSHINTTGNWGIYGAANGWSGTGYPPIADQVKTSQFGIRFSNVGGVSDHEALIANGGWTADAEI